jgi:hypothetical protein
MDKTLITGKRKAPETYDEQGHALTRSPKIELRSASAIRREMASVYRDMRTGRIEAQHGTRLVYVLEVLRKALTEEKHEVNYDGAVTVHVIRDDDADKNLD